MNEWWFWAGSKKKPPYCMFVILLFGALMDGKTLKTVNTAMLPHWPVSHTPPSVSHSLGLLQAPCRSCWQPSQPESTRDVFNKQNKTACHALIDLFLLMHQNLFSSQHFYWSGMPRHVQIKNDNRFLHSAVSSENICAKRSLKMNTLVVGISRSSVPAQLQQKRGKSMTHRS